MRQRSPSKRQRQRVLKRDNYTCRYCGSAARCIDHVWAKSNGGSNEISNLVASCYPCNITAGNIPFLSFYSKKEYILQKRGLFDIVVHDNPTLLLARQAMCP